eukprot:gene2605-biopygen17038
MILRSNPAPHPVLSQRRSRFDPVWTPQAAVSSYWRHMPLRACPLSASPHRHVHRQLVCRDRPVQADDDVARMVSLRLGRPRLDAVGDFVAEPLRLHCGGVERDEQPVATDLAAQRRRCGAFELRRQITGMHHTHVNKDTAEKTRRERHGGEDTADKRRKRHGGKTARRHGEDTAEKT